jgi:hypothetical protein
VKRDAREHDRQRQGGGDGAGAPGSPQRETVTIAGRTRQAALARLLARDGAGVLAGGRVHPAVASLIHSRRGGGGALDTGARARLEPLLGRMDDVRVHSDGTADALARSVQARAFTTGRDVFFARGEYRPGTPDGDRLIAHELAHVSQQRGASLGGSLTVTDPGDSFEREAERVAHEAAG